MRTRNDERSWGWPARLLHWTVAALIVFQLAVGVYMANFVEDIFARFSYTQTHKSFGFVVFALALLRVAWRLANPKRPADPPHAKRWETALARVTHVGFYALMFLMPVSGWLMASASTLQDQYGIKNRVFSWFELPDPFVPGSEAVEDVFFAIHVSGAALLAVLLVVHVAAALKHHFILRDDVLRRMSWGR